MATCLFIAGPHISADQKNHISGWLLERCVSVQIVESTAQRGLTLTNGDEPDAVLVAGQPAISLAALPAVYPNIPVVVWGKRNGAQDCSDIVFVGSLKEAVNAVSDGILASDAFYASLAIPPAPKARLVPDLPGWLETADQIEATQDDDIPFVEPDSADYGDVVMEADDAGAVVETAA